MKCLIVFCSKQGGERGVTSAALLTRGMLEGTQKKKKKRKRRKEKKTLAFCKLIESKSASIDVN